MKHHRRGLRRLRPDDEMLARLDVGFEENGFNQRHVAMLRYAEALTLEMSKISKVDIDDLRRAGFDDSGILQIAQVVSYFNYVNRMADGLGVELESWFATE